MDWDIISESVPAIFSALPTTLGLVGSSLLIGFILAVLVALGALQKAWFINRPANLFVYIFRSSPLLIQIFLIYYGSGQFRQELTAVGLWHLFREPWFCAVLALSLNTAAYTAEIIRGGIKSVPLDLLEAGAAIGMKKSQIFRRITFPLAIRQSLPAYGNEVILMVKSSSLASTITIMDVTGVYKEIASEYFSPLEPLLIAGSIYLLINFIATQIIAYFERRLAI
ncbi:ABC transporter permease [Endozoicomonas ascidiicola]|uniref:ABC transporter permease n=1 Tax=Endozoicomonas ascidiicola TaxID=1698521 RepID=UPI000829A77B|nr:ABC transporter permease [Endozoicomonas ascidiicola]